MEYSLVIGFNEFNKIEEIPNHIHRDVGHGYYDRKSVKFDYIDVWTKPMPIDIIIALDEQRVPLFSYYNNWINLGDFYRLDLSSIISFEITQTQICIQTGYKEEKEINCRVVGRILF